MTLTDPMLLTFLALYTGHLLGDFAFQTGWIAFNKHRLPVLALHVAIVFACTLVALGGSLLLALGIAAVHFVIDWTKVNALPDRLWSYFADQAAHLATIAVAVIWVPQAFADGLWADHADMLAAPAIVICGLLLTSHAGGPAVGLMMAPYRDFSEEDGLPNAGRMIGLLERGLIFLMVLVGEPAGIGFLIAAKSILRFNTVSENRALTEYVIIGTLASFGWALTFAMATRWALGA